MKRKIGSSTRDVSAGLLCIGRPQQMKVSTISKIKYWKEMAMQKEDNGIPQQGLDYKTHF